MSNGFLDIEELMYFAFMQEQEEKQKLKFNANENEITQPLEPQQNEKKFF